MCSNIYTQKLGATTGESLAHDNAKLKVGLAVKTKQWPQCTYYFCIADCK